MELKDENHILKTALEFYSNIVKQNKSFELSAKCDEMAEKIKCNPDTKCYHNIIAE